MLRQEEEEEDGQNVKTTYVTTQPIFVFWHILHLDIKSEINLKLKNILIYGF